MIQGLVQHILGIGKHSMTLNAHGAGIPRAIRMSGLLFILLAMAIGSNRALATSPVFGGLNPAGGQVGTELDVTITGSRLADAQEVMLYDPGISIVKLEPAADGNSIKARFKIEPTCRLGEHRLRIRTAGGITDMRSFRVGPYPSVAEVEPNSDFSKPQPIAMNVTVEGVVENEDVDYFVVEAKKGQRINAEVEGIRLGITLFDPYVAILNEKRFELAASDDTALLLQDAVAGIIAPEDGKYIIQVRETSYGGSGACRYRLHVGGYPRPRAIFPAGGKAGDEIPIAFIGDVKGRFEQKIKIPASQELFGLIAEQDGQRSPSANVFRISDFGNVMEVEPNDERAKATDAGGPLPLAFNGIIDKPGDVDYLKFAAKKGEQYEVHVYARRIRSPLDSVLNIEDAKTGANLAGNDDSGGPDSYLRFSVPHDGEFVVRVTDHLGKGGEDYIYRVEITRVATVASVSFPKPDLNRPQEAQTVSVPKGNRTAMMVAVGRANFGGPMSLKAQDLPQGVTISSQTIPGNLNAIPVLFEAAADAPVAGKLGDLIATHTDPKAGISGGFNQSVELVIGPPNQTIYFTTSVHKAAIAVTEEAPFKLQIIQPKVPLVRNGQMDLKVVVERKQGFDDPITLRMLFNPPGVGSANDVIIPKGQSEAMYPLNASGGAELGDWKIVIVGRAGVKGGTVEASTQLADLKIAEPYIAGQIPLAATEQGDDVEVVCKLDQKLAFTGAAKVILFGLPAGAASKELEITKDAKEVVFPVKIAKDAAVGQHKTLFAQVVVMENGEMVRHNIGAGGTLRIDAPPPPPKNAPPVAAKPDKKPATPEKKPEKRLSRLEQLRLEQAKKDGQTPPPGGK